MLDTQGCNVAPCCYAYILKCVPVGGEDHPPLGRWTWRKPYCNNVIPYCDLLTSQRYSIAKKTCVFVVVVASFEDCR